MSIIFIDVFKFSYGPYGGEIARLADLAERTTREFYGHRCDCRCNVDGRCGTATVDVTEPAGRTLVRIFIALLEVAEPRIGFKITRTNDSDFFDVLDPREVDDHAMGPG